MSESATQIDAPSLEQILWRSMDRFAEEPALLDAEEFAAHIFHAFEGQVPEEDFADRFLADVDRSHQPPSLAESVVRRSAQRLHVYEFDLNRLEYVIVEDRNDLVVVSEFGQFTLPSDDVVARALDAAVVKRPDRLGAEPRGYLVRKTGDVVGVDVKKIARTLEGLILRQVTAPAVEAPARRLATFNPVRRAMSPAREERALLQAPRLSRPMAPARPEEPEPAPATLVLEMPDGSLVPARIGAANRWEQMLARQARAAGRRVSIEAGGVVAIVDGAAPASAGERALAQGEALAAVRTERLPVRALGGDEVARALVAGARVVPSVGDGDRFWVQPEQAFRPEPPTALPPAPVVAQPLQLGQITGDPWADWALAVGAQQPAAAGRAALGRAELEAPAEPAPARLAAPDREALQLTGAPPVAFRAPDGSVILNRAPTRVHLSSVTAASTPVAHKPDPGTTAGYPDVSFTPADPWSRTGAVPYPVMRTLQVALERTAAARAYKLRVAQGQPAGLEAGAGLSSASVKSLHTIWVGSAPDALEAGASLELPARDERRSSVRMAGPPVKPGGTTRFLLSMPFPNRGELHVGPDLEAALDTWLAAPVAFATPSDVAPRTPAAGTLADVPRPQPFRALRPQPAGLALDLPVAAPQLAGDPSVSDLPFLLRAAVEQGGGDLTAGPGQPLFPSAALAPIAGARDVALPESRPPRAGEDEIVIPLPLWAQMGRGELAQTARIMASPIAPKGYLPPLGAYRLVVPGGGPMDLTAGAPAGVMAVELSGPTGLSLQRRASGAVTATTLGGSQFIGRVPVQEAGPAGTGRGRFRIGAPLQPADVSALVAAREPSEESPAAEPARSVSTSVRPPVSSQGGPPPGAFSPPVAVVPGSMPPVAVPMPPTPVQVAGATSSKPGAGGLPSTLASSKPAPGLKPVPGPKPGLTSGSGDEPGVLTATVVSGLPAGMWSGHRPVSTQDYRTWSYGAQSRDEPRTIGGVELAPWSGPRHPQQLPIALRFRFVGAPLWWSASTGGVSPALEREPTIAAAGGQSGVRAANSATSIWRSILVAGAPQEDGTGGMDAGREASAQAMSSVARRLDASQTAIVAAPALAAASASGPAYIAMSSTGAAGPVSAGAAARAQAVEMSIVAAIPPAPPPLESMSSAARGGEAPHARVRAPGQAAGQEHRKEADDAVSHSKIEGSVDAIAQRIYHRIRRRIQSDRERFGG